MVLVFLAVGLGAMFLAHTAPFPFLLEALEPRRSLWRLPRASVPTVYLTFDDGPNPTATPELLDVLAAQQIRATFFLIDHHVTEETGPIVRRMFAEGHAVALHSHTRALMVMTPDGLAATLSEAAARIERVAGARPCPMFRPHAGWRSGSMYAGLGKIDHTLVGWGWGLWDWNWYRARRPDEIARRISRRASPGDIIVLHDGHHLNGRADRRYTIEATSKLVPALRAKGFQFGTIC